PPQMPNPNPGEPKPIAKNPTGFVFPAGPRLVDFVLVDLASTPGKSDSNGDDSSGPGHPDNSPFGSSDRGDQQKREGNAIYKIDKDGFVTEIFRQSVVIYSMIVQNDSLLVGTGDDGNIYQVNPAAE